LKTKQNSKILITSAEWPLGGRTRVQSIRLALLSVLFLGSPLTALAQQYEAPATLMASKIVPKDLLTGPDYRIDEKVLNGSMRSPMPRCENGSGKFVPWQKWTR
jgi:hypothetical protein